MTRLFANNANETKANARRYLISSGIISILDTARGIAVVNLLGPYVIGICMTLLALLPFARYLNLGLIDAMTVLIPTFRGKEKYKEIQEVKDSVFNLTWLIACSTFLCVSIYAFLWSSESLQVNIYMAMCGTLIVFGQAKRFFVTIYVAEHKFRKVSWIELFFSVLVILLQVVLVTYFGGYGFWLGVITANIIVIICILRDYTKDQYIALFRVDWGIIKRITPLGISMLIMGVTYVPFMIISRIFLAQTSGVIEVGYFVLAMTIISKISFVSSAVARVILPKMSQLHAEMGDLQDSFYFYKRAQFYTLGLILMVIGVGMLVVEKFVSTAMPSYILGIPAAQMALIAGIPYCLIENANNFLLAVQHKRDYMFSLAKSILFQIVVFGYLYFNESISACNVSACLILIFLFYALVVNLKVVQISRRAAFVYSSEGST